MTEPKKRILYPKKLYPPPVVLKKMAEKERNKIPSNPVLRFFKLFFGEGI
jgi:hypothetical protein